MVQIIFSYCQCTIYYMTLPLVINALVCVNTWVYLTQKYTRQGHPSPTFLGLLLLNTLTEAWTCAFINKSFLCVVMFIFGPFIWPHTTAKILNLFPTFSSFVLSTSLFIPLLHSNLHWAVHNHRPSGHCGDGEMSPQLVRRLNPNVWVDK